MLIQSAFNSLKPQLRLVQRHFSRVNGYYYANRIFALEASRATTKAFFATATAESSPSTDTSPTVVVDKGTQLPDAHIPHDLVKSVPKKKKKKTKKSKSSKNLSKDEQSVKSHDSVQSSDLQEQCADDKSSAVGPNEVSKKKKAKKSKSSKNLSEDEQSVKRHDNVQSPGQQEQHADDKSSAVGPNEVADQKPATEPLSKKPGEKVARAKRQAGRRRLRIRHVSTTVSDTTDTKDQPSLVKQAKKLRIRRYPTIGPDTTETKEPFSRVEKAKTLKEALLGKRQAALILQANEKGSTPAEIQTITASELNINTIESEMAPVPGLAHGLDRVLFNPGIYHLQDPRSRVFNFDPYLQMIMPVAEFDFNALTRFVASSQDERLASIAKQHHSKYVGSTSSMTGILSHFHFLLSQWRELNLSMLSKGFSERSTSFTKLTRGPCAIMLRWKNGTYAIDADKEFDSPTILAMLGKSMEKLMVLPTEAYERYRKSDPQGVSEEEREATESYHYSTMGDFLMRSQLDAHDSRLPGTGMFDIKTRAVVSIRMSASDHEKGMGYEIRHGQGRWESFEREYYDMMRATLLKYSLQARIGRMDGIFAAFHNVERIFGFQYISLPEIDRALHGQDDTILGDQEFKISLALLNKILNRATEKFPNTSLRFHFETRDASVNFMYIFVEPVTEDEVESIQQATKERIEQYERSVLGLKPESESDEKENSKDWESIMEQVKDEMSNDAIDSGEQSTSTIGADNTCSSSEDSQGHQKQNETGQEQEEDQASDETTPTFDVAQTEAAADTTGGEASSENPQSTADTSHSTEKKSILAMTLMTRSRVNGKYHLRPEGLKPDDKWKVEYTITEISSQSRARHLYDACKRRRKSLLPQDNPEDEVEDYYRYMIRQISDKGREWRNKMDEWESQRQRVVFQAGDTNTVNPIRPTEVAS
ncbi:Pet127-domain-containing protein [Viridothelium virens]|uniref:Pet127-domain-containing protein n=1 Tax=Viridothelium virens TaxID=1048519 RepID=A0A6A6HKP0_VIRVR|nr:Pet127-domain-containing protein [Viridothelium virens]